MKLLIRISELALVLSMLGVIVRAQGAHYTYPFTLKCPEIAVGGETVTASVEFKGGYTGESYAPTYNWTVSAGTIARGQGTPSVSVDIDKPVAGSLVVTLERIFSQPHFPDVERQASCSIQVMPAPVARMTDEFRTRGGNCEEGFARLDTFFNELNNNPTNEGLIVLHGDAKDAKAAARRELQLRNHFIFRNFPRDRVRFLRGVPVENGTTQFWLIPPGADSPKIEVQPVAPAKRPTQPYVYATHYSDGIPGCSGHIYDLGQYANELKSMPGSRGRIVISESSRAKFNRTLGDIGSELSREGIVRSRFTAVYKYVRPNRVLESIELWVMPSGK